MSPHTRLRARFAPAEGNSVVTFDQSHSSSSATSWARPVRVPCPISTRATRITTVSSGLITTQALISGVASAAAAAPVPNGMWKPRERPPTAADEPARKRRRETACIVIVVSPSADFGGELHRRLDAIVRAAATDVGHHRDDVVLARLRIVAEKRRRGHDLARLAVAALRNVELRPRALHRMRAVRGKAFDGDN